MEEKIQRMALDLKEVDARSRSNTHRLDKLDAKMDTFLELTTSVKMIAQSVQYIQKDVENVQKNVKELDGKMESMQEDITEAQNKPDKETANSMKSLKDKLLWLIVGGVVVYLINLATGIQL